MTFILIQIVTKLQSMLTKWDFMYWNENPNWHRMLQMEMIFWSTITISARSMITISSSLQQLHIFNLKRFRNVLIA